MSDAWSMSTEATDEKIEEAGLKDVRDAHQYYLQRLAMYYQAQEIRRDTPTLHPLFSAANSHYYDEQRALANACALVEFKIREYHQYREKP